MKKSHWILIRDFSIAWTFALMVFSLVRGVGTIETDGVQMSIGYSLLFSPVFGTIFGFIFGLLQINFERLYNKRTPLYKLFLIGISLSYLVLVFISILAYGLFSQVLDFNALSLGDFLFNPPIFVFYGYVLVVDFLISIFRQLSIMLGPGALKKLVMGKFYNPTEEERIFMFLDLRSSTEMAEKLGHLKYSQLIQDCFDDLDVVTKTGAQIYQYVGDEAVLTWPVHSGINVEHCLLAYEIFNARIQANRDRYESRYGLLPFFKAGANIGKVMVAEVGKTKKEIAYHGDTINTAARIQGKCNEFGRSLLISENLKSALGAEHGLELEHMGEIELKGKAQQVAIYAVA